MPPQVIEHAILAFMTLGIVLSLGLLPLSTLGLAAKLLLAWSAFSTLLVGFLGAWIALRRSVRRSAGHPR